MRYSTGVNDPSGSLFLPQQFVTREAIAAFFYRMWSMSVSPDFVPPKVSPFADVQPNHQFYREIAWLYDQGIARGVQQAGGKPLFLPKESVTREAMAAFMGRFLSRSSEEWVQVTRDHRPAASPFTDLTPDSRFYNEILDMKTAGFTTGVRTETGLEFRPKDNVTREAIAAFIRRIYKF